MGAITIAVKLQSRRVSNSLLLENGSDSSSWRKQKKIANNKDNKISVVPIGANVKILMNVKKAM